MVQCAHFAFDDEELSNQDRGAGGQWGLKDEDQELEETPLDSEELLDALCFADEIDSPTNQNQEQIHCNDEKTNPTRPPILESEQRQRNSNWKSI